MMDPHSRLSLIESFDNIRSAFLASLDQTIAEMRPKLAALPGEYSDESIIACAAAFADCSLVRAQLEVLNPGVLGMVEDDNVTDAHLLAVSYLLSLTIHELIKNQPEAVLP